MKIENLSLVYFSATNTTKKVVKAIADGFKFNKKNEYNLLAEEITSDVVMTKEDLLILGMPSYSGRMPSIVFDSLNKLKGNNTPVVLACTYGNREYDDTLLEMKNTIEAKGFKVISVGAFVTQHSIFPKVAEGRPNSDDLVSAKNFGEENAKILDKLESLEGLTEPSVKGNFPYRIVKKIPLKPTGNSKCTSCGSCAKQCPVQAIGASTPKKTDGDLCINCGRCIKICPDKARGYHGINGLLYKIASKKFIKNNSARKENEFVFAK